MHTRGSMDTLLLRARSYHTRVVEQSRLVRGGAEGDDDGVVLLHEDAGDGRQRSPLRVAGDGQFNAVLKKLVQHFRGSLWETVVCPSSASPRSLNSNACHDETVRPAKNSYHYRSRSANSRRAEKRETTKQGKENISYAYIHTTDM